MEHFDLIRRAYFLEKQSIRQIAKQHQIHRRIVRQAVLSAVPPNRPPYSKTNPKLSLLMKQVIDDWLNSDLQVHAKQRHTAHRIYTRLKTEYDFKGAEPTIRKHVGQRRKALFLPNKTFVIQNYVYGEVADVDWYEVRVDFPTGQQKVYIFQMRACASGKSFHRASFTQNQQAFIEAHADAFEYFGGVFKKIKFDNLTSAVKKVLTGRKRDETERFVILRSHYLFEAFFCKPGIEGAHEKGGVEGGVGFFRRNYLVPIPKAKDIEDFNHFLMSSCALENDRKISGQVKTIGEKWAEEKQHLLALPKSRLQTQEIRTAKVNDKSLISLYGNYYSVPVQWVGRTLEVHLGSNRIHCYLAGDLVASHLRVYGSHEIILLLDHYLELLRYKPGAFEGSLVLAQTKARDEWPEIYQTFLKKSKERLGNSKGIQELIEVLLLHKTYGKDRVLLAIGSAIEHGCYDMASVLMLIRQQDLQKEKVSLLKGLQYLHQYDRPVQSLVEYNKLLT
jgi:transposase